MPKRSLKFATFLQSIAETAGGDPAHVRFDAAIEAAPTAFVSMVHCREQPDF